jgi:hypothetical protein
VGPLFAILLVASAGAGVIGMARNKTRRRIELWRRAAEACRLDGVGEEKTLGFFTGLGGRHGDLPVRIETVKRGKHSVRTRVTVRGLDAAAELRLAAEDIGTTVRKGLGAREVELGDETFDGRFFIQGPPAVAFALLDAATRQRVWAAMKSTVTADCDGGVVEVRAEAELKEGVLAAEFSEGWGDDLERTLPGALATLLAAADALAWPRDLPRQLADNARTDPLWAVRLGNLRTLAREFPGHPLTRDTLRAGLQDAAEEVRLRAAQGLDDEGTATLLDLAGAAAYDATASEAIRILGPRLAPQRALEILAEARRVGKAETALACLELLRVHPRAPAWAEVQPAMLDLLGSADEDVRVLAARVLGAAGTVTAVPPLLEAGERLGGALRGAARQAVAEIQSRLTGASPGQVSLSGTDAGQVSLAEEGKTGAVSVPEAGPDT